MLAPTIKRRSGRKVLHPFLKGNSKKLKIGYRRTSGLCDLMASFAPEEEKLKWLKPKSVVTNISCEDINDSISICSCQIKTSYEGEETIDEKVELKKWVMIGISIKGKNLTKIKDADQEENMLLLPRKKRS